MPRPRKWRKVCCLPDVNEFIPAHHGAGGYATVVMTVEEYETIRLIDNEGFSQEECSEYMQIARTTVQQTYNTARKKLAQALVLGEGLLIQGGDYQLCDGSEPFCSCGGCLKHRGSRREPEKPE